MFGSKELFSKKKIESLKKSEQNAVQDLINTFNLNVDLEQLKNKLEELSFQSFLGRLYIQAKMISQIVCFVWRWADSEDREKERAANKIKEYFEHPTPFDAPNQTGENLKKFLGADPRNEDTKEAKLLRKVFPDYMDGNLLFPIFNEFELAQEKDDLGYLFLVNINSFHGMIEDATKNTPELFTFEIPYPPSPKFSNSTVTEKELEDWIANRKKDEFFAENPYIPTSCS